MERGAKGKEQRARSKEQTAKRKAQDAKDKGQKTKLKAQTVISISNLHKSFGAQHVLRSVSLEVSKGETFVLLGRSGSGKSVLLKCLVGLLQPDAGSIKIDETEIVGLARVKLDEMRKRIGYVFQHAALYDSMTVAENLAFHLDRNGRLPREERERIIREKLSFVGMEAALRQYPAELSGGMQKRVGLARALVLSPDLVLYDEPTTGLDPITTAEIDELITRLKRQTGVTALSITHDIISAGRTADRIGVLYHGEIIAQGSLQELRNHSHPFVQEYFSAGALASLPEESFKAPGSIPSAEKDSF
jgi:phospholipid/cholesterol/gamma-HCH transport system ATP-binding protein